MNVEKQSEGRAPSTPQILPPAILTDHTSGHAFSLFSIYLPPSLVRSIESQKIQSTLATHRQLSDNFTAPKIVGSASAAKSVRQCSQAKACCASFGRLLGATHPRMHAPKEPSNSATFFTTTARDPLDQHEPLAQRPMHHISGNGASSRIRYDMFSTTVLETVSSARFPEHCGPSCFSLRVTSGVRAVLWLSLVKTLMRATMVQEVNTQVLRVKRGKFNCLPFYRKSCSGRNKLFIKKIYSQFHADRYLLISVFDANIYGSRKESHTLSSIS